MGGKDGSGTFDWEEFLILVVVFAAFILPLVIFVPMLIRSLKEEKTG